MLIEELTNDLNEKNELINKGEEMQRDGLRRLLRILHRELRLQTRVDVGEPVIARLHFEQEAGGDRLGHIAAVLLEPVGVRVVLHVVHVAVVVPLHLHAGAAARTVVFVSVLALAEPV